MLPSLFRTVAPLLAPKYSPLPLIASLVMLVMFWFSLFSSTLYCTPSVSVTEVRYFPSPLNFTVGVVSLVSVTVFWLPLSAVTPNWALILVTGLFVVLLMLLISLFLSIPYVTFLSLRLTVIVSSAVANSIVGVVASPSFTWLVVAPAFRLKPAFRLLMSVLLFWTVLLLVIVLFSWSSSSPRFNPSLLTVVLTYLSPLTVSGVVELMVFVPFGVFASWITQFTSPLMLLTASFRSPMVAALFFWSSLAFASAVPFSALFTLLIVDPPTFTVPSPSVIVVLLLPAFPFEIDVIPFSALASIILMLVLPLASWLTLVLMFSPEYSLSAFVPSPWIFTVLPSLFRTVAPLLAPKYSPLPLIASLVMLVMFWFSLFSSTLYCTPSVSVTEVRYFPSPLNFTVGVVSLVSVTVFWLPLSAVTPNWALILVIGVVVLLLILVIRSPVIFLTSLFLSIPYVTFLSLRLTVIVSSAVANSIVGVVPSPSLTWLVALPAFRLKPLFRLLMSVLLF